MKILYIILMLIGFMFILGCSQQNEQTPASMPAVLPATAEAPKSSQGELKEFTITAKQFEFSPSIITVTNGDRVKITITSTDVTHGFMLPDFGINEKLEPNKPVTVEFVADKTGTFPFRCNVPCGSGHMNMKGTIVVE